MAGLQSTGKIQEQMDLHHQQNFTMTQADIQHKTPKTPGTWTSMAAGTILQGKV